MPPRFVSLTLQNQKRNRPSFKHSKGDASLQQRNGCTGHSEKRGLAAYYLKINWKISLAKRIL